MSEEVETAYLVCTPNPKEYPEDADPERNPLWIKFGDTKKPKNTRVSGYNTHNPSFYALTIHADKDAVRPNFGKSLETEFFKNKNGYTPVEIKNREIKPGETEWYKVTSGKVYTNVIKLFEDIEGRQLPGIAEKLLGIQSHENEGVWGKVLTYTGENQKGLADVFKDYLKN
ncbi:hypothetical protein CEK26_005242 [Fusarium fujikuroi]|uniref:Uncharacterized protein n=1 Tax=Fusarium fujikuroi TaxID=5127 RepID=A0A5Q3FLX3_FUSFU|nr:hypothetical protein CEK27_005246 [Fusarium fujikuroi]QGI92173.1 hypothetical protein CEK26_005242 [Fusarium fujikuroi]SCN71686.1 uncharacterized protein FFE2_02358 [Fusarium fujikuroi]SCO35455.1 uncharacterized protein FFNC_04471 [Fusarium fujikuroi]SCV36910.1 uncharacterized protein FFFS_05423 [Fusarium fujikuroi]